MFDDFLPLSPATLHILLSLAGEERHGYGIMQDVARQTKGRYKLGPGTLYDNLQKLMKQRMVQETAGPPGNDDTRRRYYRLTKLGKGVLSAEVARLDGVVREAKLHLSLPNARSATRSVRCIVFCSGCIHLRSKMSSAQKCWGSSMKRVRLRIARRSIPISFYRSHANGFCVPISGSLGLGHWWLRLCSLA